MSDSSPTLAAYAAPLRPAPRTVSLTTLLAAVVAGCTVGWAAGGRVSVQYTGESIVIDWSGVRPPRPIVPPTPQPEPAPSPAVSPRVLFLYDGRSARTAAQTAALSSTVVRAYLGGYCVADPDGRPAWRFWDRATDVSRESESWRSAMAAALAVGSTGPTMHVFDGSRLAASIPIDSESGLVAALESLRQGGLR